MANHASAEKRNRQRIQRTTRNRAVTSSVRTAIKKARAAIAGGDAKGAAPIVQAASLELARAASKGTLHARTASRVTSRIQSALAKLAR
jgi:small subunit ribosomal protein S20